MHRSAPANPEVCHPCTPAASRGTAVCDTPHTCITQLGDGFVLEWAVSTASVAVRQHVNTRLGNKSSGCGKQWMQARRCGSR